MFSGVRDPRKVVAVTWVDRQRWSEMYSLGNEYIQACLGHEMCADKHINMKRIR